MTNADPTTPARFLADEDFRRFVPVHVVWGREDKILPSAYAALWGERVPGAQVSMVDACGHSPHMERADLIADKVLAFLDRVRP